MDKSLCPCCSSDHLEHWWNLIHVGQESEEYTADLSSNNLTLIYSCIPKERKKIIFSQGLKSKQANKLICFYEIIKIPVFIFACVPLHLP